MKILFVCHGNICRSPMAEFVMKHLLSESGRADVEVASAALHTDALGCYTHRGTRAVLAERAIPFSRRAAWLINAAKAREFDLIVGMDDYNIADLKRLVHPEDQPKIHKLLSFAGSSRDVADPWYTGDFNVTYEDVLAGCRALLEKI